MINYAPQDQFTVAQANVIRPAYATITISAFVLSNPSDTTSAIAGTASFGNTVPFSIALPFQQNVTNPDTSYMICVRFTTDEGITYRYVLFDANDAFSTTFPDYTGQTIGPSAVIEVWANPDDLTIMSSDDIVFYLNTLTRYGNETYAYCPCYSITPTETTLEPTL